MFSFKARVESTGGKAGKNLSSLLAFGRQSAFGISQLFFSIFLLFLLSPDCAAAQDKTQPGWKIFDLVLWPEKGGFIDSVTSPAAEKRLENAWFDACMPTYSGRALRTMVPENNSLEVFLRLIQTTRPSAIEGDSGFVERNVNQPERIYIPFLERIDTKNGKESVLHGEIVFASPQPKWEGVLGVIHPDFSIGGKAQIDYWREQTGKDTNWVAFQSGKELLRHLFAGSIEAAAVPEETIGAFLREIGREDLANRIVRMAVPQAFPHTQFYLRRDLYDDLFLRTLISETWLRDRFPEGFKPVSAGRR